MLLRPIIRNQCLHICRQSFRPSSTGLSDTTTIILRRLPASTTEGNLTDALKDIKCRKVELEPGCLVHVGNEAEALSGQKFLKSKFGFESSIACTSMPTLLLNNLPSNVSTQILSKSFAGFDPKLVRVIGGVSVQVDVSEVEDALKLSKLIENTKFGDQHPTCHVVKLPSQKFAVNVSNIPSSVSATAAAATVQALLPLLSNASGPTAATVSSSVGSAKTALLRFPSTLSVGQVDEISNVLRNLVVDGQLVDSVSAPKQLTKPALMLRKIHQAGDKAVLDLLKANTSLPAPARVQLLSRSKDVSADMAVAFYHSEEQALSALNQLHGVSLQGKKISVGYREMAEPAVVLSNLPAELTTQAALSAFLATYNPAHIEFSPSSVSNEPGADTSLVARVTLPSPKEVQTIVAALHKKDIHGKKLLVTESNVHDIGIEVSLPGGLSSPQQQLLSALHAAGVHPQALSLRTNLSAVIGFLTMQEALNAHSGFVSGKVNINSTTAAVGESGLVSSHISSHPAFAIEVRGLNPTEPASNVQAALSTASESVGSGETAENIRVLQVDRSAILKFKRHMDIVPSLKQLKQVSIEGVKLHPYRFRNSLHTRQTGVEAGSADLLSEYQADGDDEAFDRFSLRHLLRDYMHADPATRYQIAKNSFERQLVDAQGLKDINFLLDKSITKEARDEAKVLLAQKPSSIVTDRLFQLFLQREDMAAFLKDFNELTSILGAPNEEDAFDWSQFRIEIGDDIARLHSELKKVEGDSAASQFQSADTAVGKEIVIKGETDKEAATIVSLEDPTSLRDKEGRMWSGAILDTDTVQKPMPGNRILSHRALVVVGNMRGSAGFGMGKGKTVADAINAAFRDSLRNLTHIDLYDNFGLAHDVHGKHNSCHAYVRATPRGRMIVASPFANAILLRFGISSASVKLAGRRDPYAMVRAMFNALQQHENVDEYAKDRGKRYLTLKWAHDNDV